MNWDKIEGRWKQLKGSAKVKWGELTEGDLDYIAGKQEQLAGKIQERYGIAKDEARRQVDEWAKSLREQERVEEAHPAMGGRR